MTRWSAGSKVSLLCGAIFTLIGSITFVLAFVLAANMDDLVEHGRGDVELMPLVFGFTGGISLVLGIVILALHSRAGQKKRRLLEQGEHITAEITGFPMDYSARVNGWPTYRIECSYLDPRTKTIHVFLSDNLRIDPSRYVTQRTVLVYVDRDSDFQDYYVDIEPLLPDVKRH